MKLEKRLEVQAWLKKAKDDLRAAQIDLDALPPSAKMLSFIVSRHAKRQ